MKLRKTYLFAMLPVFLLAACDKETEVPENAIVTVYDNSLSSQDLDKIIPSHYTAEDSAEIADSYVRSWVQKELLYNYAKGNLSSTDEIEAKVEEFRRELYCHEVEEKYIHNNLDSVVDMLEIEAYYKSHLGEYKLTKPVVKAHYMIMDVKVLTYYYELDKVRRSTPDNMKELRNSTRNTNKKIIEHKEWIYLDDFLREIKTDRNPQVDAGLQLKYFFTEDDENRFVVKINDMKEIGDTVPLNLVSDEISRVIIKQRREDLLTNLINDLNQDAKSKQNLVYNEN